VIDGKKVECKHAFPKEEVYKTKQKQTPEKTEKKSPEGIHKSVMQLREMMME